MTKLFGNQSGLLSIWIAVFLIQVNSFTYGQGCSDAGFCTISSFKDNSVDSIADKKYKNAFSLALSYGIGDFNIAVFNPYIQYSRELSSRVSLSARVYYLSASGSLTHTQGLSDLFLTSSYTMFPNTKATLGFKIPFNDGNLKQNDLPLPMNYQTSLGTFDLILGVTQSVKNLHITFALQQPITQNNNQYLREGFQPASGPSYLSTNKFKRSGDVLLKATYTLSVFRNKFKIIPGLLPIYHLANDRYFSHEAGQEVPIKGSQGLTLNGTLSFQYLPHSRHRFEWSAGTPFTARAKRPDGLTRKLVTSLEYKFNF